MIDKKMSVWGYSDNSKSFILSVLVYDYPLTAKGLFEYYNDCHCESKITYQAVHKALKELVKNGIIDKEGSNYKLNKKWIEFLDDYVHSAKSKYGVNRKKETDEKKRIVELLYDMQKRY